MARHRPEVVSHPVCDTKQTPRAPTRRLRVPILRVSPLAQPVAARWAGHFLEPAAMLFSTSSERYLHFAIRRMTAPLRRGRPLAR